MKNTVQFKNLTTLMMGTCLLGAVSCGSDGKAPEIVPTHNPVEVREVTTGKYVAQLKAINPSVSAAYGSAEIVVTDETFSVSVKMSNLSPSLSHRQAIYASDVCPRTSAEASKGILIPLDGDLSSQGAVGYGYPFSDSYGEYGYSESILRSILLHDLKSGTGEGDYVRLSASSSLNLSGKVIAVRGTLDDEGMPVACGKIIRLHDVDGTGTKH